MGQYFKRGVGLDIKSALDVMNADQWRFALMQLYPDGADTEFSIEILVEIINNILNDKIGNLANRVFTIIQRNTNIIIRRKDLGVKFSDQIDSIKNNYVFHFDNLDIKGALKNIVELADLGNSIMSSAAPWQLVKKPDDPKSMEELSMVMHTLLKIVRDIGILLYPFTPTSSLKILAHFGIKNPKIELLTSMFEFDSSKDVHPIFSKIDSKMFEKFK